MRARGELRAGDLRFTPREADLYLAEVARSDLATEDAAALEERTEGRIAALQLAVLSLQGREDVGGFIARFAGNDPLHRRLSGRGSDAIGRTGCCSAG